MADVASLGLKVEGKQVEQAQKSLDKLSASAKKAETAAGGFGRGATAAGASASRANATAATSANRLSAAYGRVRGSVLSAAKSFAIMAAATVGIAATVRTLSNFEQAMAAVGAITRSTASEMSAMRKIAKELGATTEFTAAQAAEGLKFLGMAGFSARKSIAALPDVLNLATAAQMDLGNAADISSNIMSAFGIKADKAADVADILAAAASRANTDVKQLGDAMKFVGPVASALGVSMGDAAAAIGTLSDAGIQGGMAGTSLRRVMSALVSPTKQSADAIRSMGLSVDELNPKTNSLVSIVGKLKVAGIDAGDAFTIFGQRGGPAILALVENEPKLRALSKTLGDVGGEAQRMADAMRDSLAGDFKNLTSALENVIITMGEAGLIAILRAVAQSFTALFRNLSGAISSMSSLASMASTLLAPALDVVAEYADIAVVAIAGFYAPAVLLGIATLTKAIGVGLVTAIKRVTAVMLANPIGLFVAALAAAAYAVYKFRDVVKAVFGVDIDGIIKSVAGSFDISFSSAFRAVAQGMDTMYEGFTGNMAAMGSIVVTTADNLVTAMKWAADKISHYWTKLIFELKDGLNGLNIPGLNFGLKLETSDPGELKLKSFVEEAKKAFDAGKRTLGAVDALDKALGRIALSKLGDAFDISLLDMTGTSLDKVAESSDKAAVATGKVGKAAKAAADNFEKERQAAYKTQREAVSALNKEAQAMEDQVDVYGQGAHALEKLTIARLEEQKALLSGFKGSKEQVELLQDEIDARERLMSATANKEALDANKTAAEAAAAEWQKTNDSIGQSLTDALLRGFESGKGFAENLKSTLINMFKTMILQPIIQPVMNQVAGGIQGAFGMGPQGQQKNGVGDTLSNANSLNSIFGAGYQAMTGASAGASTASLGYANMVGAFGGDSIGALISANGGWEGAMAGFGSAAGGAAAAGTVAGITSGVAGLGASLGATIGTGTAAMASTTFAASLGGAGAAAGGGAAMGGLGAAMGVIGTAMPYVGAVVAIASALGAFDGGPPKTRQSERSTTMLVGGKFVITEQDERQSAEAARAARNMAEQSVKAANDLFKKIGADASIDYFHAITESSVLGDRNGVASGGSLTVGGKWVDFGIAGGQDATQQGVGGLSEEAMMPRLQQDIQLSILQAFQAASDQLPDVLARGLEGVNIRALSDEDAQSLVAWFTTVVQQVEAFQAAVEALPFENLRDLSFDAAAGLVAAAGGLENLNAGTTAYFQNFYSKQEQFDFASKRMTVALAGIGFVMPDLTLGADSAKAALRSFVEGLDVNTKEGQRAFAGAMNLAQGFAQLTGSMDQLAQSTQTTQQMWDATKGVTDSALADVKRLGQAEIARLQQSFGQTDAAFAALERASQSVATALQSVMDALTKSVRELRGEVDSTAAMQYRQARAAISTALVTGQVSDPAGMQLAIQAAQKGVQSGVYASKFEQDKAYLSLAAEMESLQGIAGPQLTAAQETLELARKQYNALRGIDDRVLTVAQAAQRLQTAMAAETQANAQIAAIQRQMDSAQAQYDALRGNSDALTDLNEAIAALAAALSAERAGAYFGNNPDVAGAYAANSGGMSEAEYAAMHYEKYGKGEGRDAPMVGSRGMSYLDNNPDVAADYLKYGQGMTVDQYAKYHYDKYGQGEGRAFAAGTNYVPYDMQAQIHEGERIIPKADNTKLMSSSTDMVAELRALREEVAGLRNEQSTSQFAIAKNTGKVVKNTNYLDRWNAEGMPAEQAEVTV